MAALIGIWDTYVLFRPNGSATVSNILGGWAMRYPILPFSIGMLAGHIFWPRG